MKMDYTERYEIDIFPDPEKPDWFCARVPDIPSIFTGGDSPEEALRMVKEAIAGYLEICCEDDLPVPETAVVYTEELAVRFPKDMHWVLVKEVERQEVSVNELITSVLNRSLFNTK